MTADRTSTGTTGGHEVGEDADSFVCLAISGQAQGACASRLKSEMKGSSEVPRRRRRREAEEESESEIHVLC